MFTLAFLEFLLLLLCVLLFLFKKYILGIESKASSMSYMLAIVCLFVRFVETRSWLSQ